MTSPADPGFPRGNEGAALLAELEGLPVRPVFITTFLYDCIAKSFPLAQLSLYICSITTACWFLTAMGWRDGVGSG
ncbi:MULTISPECIES: hypothetical protein [unclassified Microbulbifer]|uniref:hypothetical protein n=1 Tax=unclassified Microbulbifer TaxID=2619833 RepID=UPI0027E472A4|nr:MULTISPECIES: hypothetical protein [unclassified Microbulbifer]